MIAAATTTGVRRCRIGRSPPCVNANEEDYKLHRMRKLYMRSSMIDGRRARNSRSMISIGYYCFRCQQFWTDEQADMIVEELREKRIQECLSSLAAKKGHDYA
jgi:hypothetical protein